MNRNYTTGTADAVTFFVGKEIEHTPAVGMTTLFVVGVHEPDSVLDYAKHPSGIEHIYFGANQSFSPESRDDWAKWTDMVHVALEAGYWCTLDLDVKHAELLLEWGLPEKHRFIPMISVKLPYLQQLGYNATIKLDDKDFEASNPGVWCHTIHSLTTRETFTNWNQYSKDEVLK